MVPAKKPTHDNIHTPYHHSSSYWSRREIFLVWGEQSSTILYLYADISNIVFQAIRSSSDGEIREEERKETILFSNSYQPKRKMNKNYMFHCRWLAEFQTNANKMLRRAQYSQELRQSYFCRFWGLNWTHRTHTSKQVIECRGFLVQQMCFQGCMQILSRCSLKHFLIFCLFILDFCVQFPRDNALLIGTLLPAPFI